MDVVLIYGCVSAIWCTLIKYDKVAYGKVAPACGFSSFFKTARVCVCV